MTYIRIRSWHVLRTWSRVPGVGVTLCGKRASGETATSFGDDKSCESCLRIAAKADTFAAVAEPAEDRVTL